MIAERNQAQLRLAAKAHEAADLKETTEKDTTSIIRLTAGVAFESVQEERLRAGALLEWARAVLDELAQQRDHLHQDATDLSIQVGEVQREASGKSAELEQAPTRLAKSELRLSEAFMELRPDTFVLTEEHSWQGGLTLSHPGSLGCGS